MIFVLARDDGRIIPLVFQSKCSAYDSVSAAYDAAKEIMVGA